MIPHNPINTTCHAKSTPRSNLDSNLYSHTLNTNKTTSILPNWTKPKLKSLNTSYIYLKKVSLQVTIFPLYTYIIHLFEANFPKKSKNLSQNSQSDQIDIPKNTQREKPTNHQECKRRPIWWPAKNSQFITYQ